MSRTETEAKPLPRRNQHQVIRQYGCVSHETFVGEQCCPIHGWQPYEGIVGLIVGCRKCAAEKAS